MYGGAKPSSCIEGSGTKEKEGVRSPKGSQHSQGNCHAVILYFRFLSVKVQFISKGRSGEFAFLENSELGRNHYSVLSLAEKKVGNTLMPFLLISPGGVFPAARPSPDAPHTSLPSKTYARLRSDQQVRLVFAITDHRDCLRWFG